MKAIVSEYLQSYT